MFPGCYLTDKEIADAKNRSRCEHALRQAIDRAVHNLQHYRTHDVEGEPGYQGAPLWSAVAYVFGFDSHTAQETCREAGVNPAKQVACDEGKQGWKEEYGKLKAEFDVAQADVRRLKEVLRECRRFIDASPVPSDLWASGLCRELDEVLKGKRIAEAKGGDDE